MASLNSVELIGNLGADPEIKSLQNGSKVANLRLATTESWKDKTSGEKKERTEWHRIVIWNEGLVAVCDKYLKKGMQIYVCGQLQTRKWEKDGVDQYSTEVVLNGFSARLLMLGQKGDGGGRSDPGPQERPASGAAASPKFGGDDDVPF